MHTMNVAAELVFKIHENLRDFGTSALLIKNFILSLFLPLLSFYTFFKLFLFEIKQKYS